MQTVELDPQNLDDRTAAAWHDLQRGLELEEDPTDEPRGLEQLLLEARAPRPEEHITRWLVRDDSGAACASAELEVRDSVDNRHLAFGHIGVRTERRRQGLGSQLLRQCAEAARAAGRTTLFAGAPEGSAGDRFLAASGGAFVFLARRSRCPVAALDRGQLLQWAQRPPGYTILTWDAPTLDDRLEAYARVLHVMNTAPTQDADVEDEVFTADLLRGWERALLERKGAKWVSVAVHDSTGDLVGLSELYFDGFRADRVHQGDTGVEPGHRGRGLGRALKAVNALRLLDERPAARFIDTFNQDANAPMLAINDAMGFRPHLRYRKYQLRVDALLSG